jgi:hypothetical protein
MNKFVATAFGRLRAESPVIISTGQRPVGKGAPQQPALKGRNPVIDSISPLRGLGGEAASTPRVTPAASPAVMHNPALAGRSAASESGTDFLLVARCETSGYRYCALSGLRLLAAHRAPLSFYTVRGMVLCTESLYRDGKRVALMRL